LPVFRVDLDISQAPFDLALWRLDRFANPVKIRYSNKPSRYRAWLGWDDCESPSPFILRQTQDFTESAFLIRASCASAENAPPET
jgi:hypothetical protein